MTVTHAATTAPIDLADWNADHVDDNPVVFVASGGNIQTAINALPSSGGIIQLDAATYTITTLSLNSKTAVTIRGVGGRTAGADGVTILSHTGTGSGSVITTDAAIRVGFEDLQIRYTSSSFTGKLINTESAALGQTLGLFLKNVIVDGVRTYGQTAELMRLNQAIECRFDDCIFLGGGIAVMGRPTSAATDFTNIVNFTNCEFRRQSVIPVRNVGEAWTFTSCNFQGKEANPSGADVGAIDHGSGILASGLLVQGCGTYDQTTTNTGSWFKVGGTGLTFIGNKSSGRQVSQVTFVEIDADSSDGVLIAGNALDNMYKGLDFGTTTGHMRGAFYGNAFSNTVSGWLSVAGTLPQSISIVPSDQPTKPDFFVWAGGADGATNRTSLLQFDNDTVARLYRLSSGVLYTPATLTTAGRITSGYAGTAGTQLWGTASETIAGMSAVGGNSQIDLWIDQKGSTSRVKLNANASTATAGVQINGHIEEPTTISPTQLVANTDNWNPTNLSSASMVRINVDAARNITGIVAQAAGSKLRLHNTTAFIITLVHDATSTAANRFYCPNNADVSLRPHGTVEVWYDTAVSRWLVIAP